MPARTSGWVALLAPCLWGMLVTLPAEGTGLIQAVYLPVSNIKTNNFHLSLKKNRELC